MAEAVSRLNDLVSNYRSHHVQVCDLAKRHPTSVNEQLHEFMTLLCQLLALKPPAEVVAAAAPAAITCATVLPVETALSTMRRTSSAGPDIQTGAHKNGVKSAVNGSTARRATKAQAKVLPDQAIATAAGSMSPALMQPHRPIQLATGTSLVVEGDLLYMLQQADAAARRENARSQLQAEKAALQALAEVGTYYNSCPVHIVMLTLSA